MIHWKRSAGVAGIALGYVWFCLGAWTWAFGFDRGAWAAAFIASPTAIFLGMMVGWDW